MQSIATVVFIRRRGAGARYREQATPKNRSSSSIALAFDDLLAAVIPARADVMAQVDFAGGRLDRERRIRQKIVRAMHPALGRGLLVLLDCHVELL
jgi:hypothetical protein